jgi:hypothetical protein
VVSATDPTAVNLGFIDRRCYFLIQVPPQLFSRGSGDPVPDLLLLRKSAIEPGTSGSVVRMSDRLTTEAVQTGHIDPCIFTLYI